MSDNFTSSQPILNRLLHVEEYSLANYLMQAPPWTCPGEEPQARVVRRIAEQQQADAVQIGLLLIRRYGHAESSRFQRIVLTRRDDDLRLYLNGNLQFSSRDEYRYHEALVHPAMGRVASPRNVLILGGGDGLAAREVLRYPSVERVTLVDLDPVMTGLFA